MMRQLAAVALLAIAAVLAAGCGGGAADTADTIPVDAARYVRAINPDVLHVEAAVAAVAAEVEQVAGGSATLPDLSAVVAEAHSQLDDLRLAIATSDVPGSIETVREHLFTGADDIKSSFGALRKYIDSAAPSDLADYRTQYSRGVSEWNSAVTGLYEVAGVDRPPTIDVPAGG